MGGTPSVPRDSSQKLKVIGAGFSRTGTVTMQLALEKLLNGPVMHGGTHILSREDAFTKNWVLAYEAKRRGDVEQTRKLVSQLMAGYVGCTDLPPVHFLPELLHLYPEAKVVLVTRDPDRWLASILPIARNSLRWWLKLAVWPVPGWRWFPSLVWWFSESSRLARGVEPGEPDREGLSKATLLKWNEYVKTTVPKDRLLVMELKEGWEPLCKFLDVPVPDEPLPRANDALAAERTAKIIFGQLLLIWLGIFSVIGLFGFGISRLCLPVLPRVVL